MWCLLQSGDYGGSSDGALLGGGGILALAIAVACGVIVGNKGHGAGQVVVHVIVGLFCWPLSLFYALRAEDFRAKQQKWEWEQRQHHAALAAQQRANILAETQRLRTEVDSLREQSGYAGLDREQVGELGGPMCTRCGSPLTAGMKCPNCRRVAAAAQAGHELIQRPLIVSAPPPIGVPPVDSAVRVQCRICGKRLSGDRRKIQMLSECPKCGAAPFDYKPLPPKS